MQTQGIAAQLSQPAWILSVPPVPVEVVGFTGHTGVCMPLSTLPPLSPGLPVIASPINAHQRLPAAGMLNGLGLPYGTAWDKIHALPDWSLPPISPKDRRPPDTPWATGVKILDTMTTLAEGQRIGIFAGPGVGKSTLLHQILRQATYDDAVVALIGERGREASSFWDSLDSTTRKRVRVIVATADDPPLVRLRAMDVAHHLARVAPGPHTLLVVDSLTRVAHASREVGLALGEPPSARGYPPSLFARLPQWTEQTGKLHDHTITALYTVLLDADNINDPIGDAVRGLLDGHIVLDRQRAERDQFPAIDPLASLSRLQRDVLPENTRQWIAEARTAWQRTRDTQDLRAVGVYQAGSDPITDRALQVATQLDAWARQDAHTASPWEDTWESFLKCLQE